MGRVAGGVPPDIAARAAELEAAGMSRRKIAVELGISEPTLRKAMRAGGAKIRTPKKPELPRFGGGSHDDEPAGGLNAALEAAGEETGGNGRSDDAPEGVPPPPQPPLIDQGAALVQMCEVTTLVIMRAYAARMKVKWTDTMSKAARLTKPEKDLLGTFAPAAAPYLMRILSHSDKIAAACFALAYASMLADRGSLIKEQAPRKVIDAEQVRPAPATAGAVPSPSGTD